jgi:outer membrane lipoprotein-sorting protein
MKIPFLHQFPLSALLAIAILAPNSSLHAQDAKAKGSAIAKASDDSDNGFGDSAVRLKMKLKTSSGRTTERILDFKTFERANSGVGDKSIVVFSSPADIDGTALLSHAKLVDPDDQWLYLPALKRVKRISSKNKSGPFVGSEFAFEDFTATEFGKYDYKFIRTETFAGLTCDVIERYPKYEFSGYTKTVAWIDQADKQMRKLEFFDRKGAPLKTMTLSGYKKYNGKYWRAHSLEMVNAQTGKSTQLLYAKFTFGAGLKDSDFVSTALTRTR